MIPHLHSILKAENRYFWAVSDCYKSEQIFTFVEVERKEKFANGKVISVNYSIKRYKDGILVLSYHRSILNVKAKEKTIKFVETYGNEKAVNLSMSEKEMEIIKFKELGYAGQKETM